MNVEFGTYTDPRDGEVYKTLKVGGMEWFAENLRYKANGSSSLNDDESNDKKYGRLYTQYDAMKIAPEGWHLPTEDEFCNLINALGVKEPKAYASVDDWGDEKGTNITGFNAQPVGERYPKSENQDAHFQHFGNVAEFWTDDIDLKTLTDFASYASYFEIFDLSSESDFDPDDEEKLRLWLKNRYIRMSVRLVRDAKGSVNKQSLNGVNYTPQTGSFTDPRDGKTYKTIIIGRHEWFAENLSFKCEGSLVYDNKDENEKEFGRLYHRDAIKDALPEGWELPDTKDFKALVDFAVKTCGVGPQYIGTAFKDANSWPDFQYTPKGKDVFGFAALAAGAAESSFNFETNAEYIKFEDLHEMAYFRTAKERRVYRLGEYDMCFVPFECYEYGYVSVRPFRKVQAAPKKATSKKTAAKK